MKKLLAILAASSAVLALTACATKASKEECTAACQKFSELTLAASPKPAKEDSSKKIEEEFAPKLADLDKKKADAIAVIDKEMKKKLAATKKKADKKKVLEKYTAKKSAKGLEFDVQKNALEEQKTNAVKVAEKAVERAEAADKEAVEKAIADCAMKCLKAGVKQPITECQTKATALDEYKHCQ